jgi:hypothetical protein
MRQYVTFDKIDGNLVIALLPAGREEIADAEDNSINSDAFILDLFEHPLCNGWTEVKPEEIGALTASPILTDDFQRDDDGKLIKVGRVFWFPSYQIECPVETLRDRGEVIFSRAD